MHADEIVIVVSHTLYEYRWYYADFISLTASPFRISVEFNQNNIKKSIHKYIRMFCHDFQLRRTRMNGQKLEEEKTQHGFILPIFVSFEHLVFIVFRNNVWFDYRLTSFRNPINIKVFSVSPPGRFVSTIFFFFFIHDKHVVTINRIPLHRMYERRNGGQYYYYK